MWCSRTISRAIGQSRRAAKCSRVGVRGGSSPYVAQRGRRQTATAQLNRLVRNPAWRLKRVQQGGVDHRQSLVRVIEQGKDPDRGREGDTEQHDACAEGANIAGVTEGDGNLGQQSKQQKAEELRGCHASFVEFDPVLARRTDDLEGVRKAALATPFPLNVAGSEASR